jgi:hypothetical protein
MLRLKKKIRAGKFLFLLETDKEKPTGQSNFIEK